MVARHRETIVITLDAYTKLMAIVLYCAKLKGATSENRFCKKTALQ